MIPALIITLLLQIATRPENGTVSGILKDPTGKLAAGVRVAVVSQPESIAGQANTAMVRIAETDSEGRYKLDDVPQGRYYIAAGRVDQPTYYPGSKEMARAEVVSV